jgi:hypothetical protein
MLPAFSTMKICSTRDHLPWLGRYAYPLPIRSRGSFQVVSASRVDNAKACVVIAPGPTADPGQVAEALAEIERVHAYLDHPNIPKVAKRGVADGTPYLEFDCDAVMDGTEFYRLVTEAGQSVTQESADGFISGLFKAMQTAHVTIDPERRGPVCLGRVSSANLLFSPDGRFYLIGYGRNFPVENDRGTHDGWVTTFQAPEVAFGGEATPSGDYVALLLFARSLLPVVKMSTMISRVVRGDIHLHDHELLKCLRWYDQHVLGAPVGRRKSIQEARAVTDHIRRLTCTAPDLGAFSAFVAKLVCRLAPPRAATDAGDSLPNLVVGLEVSWVAGPDGEQHLLGRPHSRIVAAFIDRHHEAPGATLTTQDLLQAGWPGERLVADAGVNRVYVALTQLRRMGLRNVLEYSEDGYRLVPRTVVWHQGRRAFSRLNFS